MDNYFRNQEVVVKGGGNYSASQMERLEDKQRDIEDSEYDESFANYLEGLAERINNDPRKKRAKSH